MCQRISIMLYRLKLDLSVIAGLTRNLPFILRFLKEIAGQARNDRTGNVEDAAHSVPKKYRIPHKYS